jgi:hypothetical protein
MSRKKRTPPNYQHLYREQLDANWALEQRNRENERKIREQTIIANQMAQSEARMRQDVARIEREVSAAERRAAADRARLHEMQRDALQQIAGIKVDLHVTQEQIQSMQWENQELHRLAAQDRQQIKDQVERARHENLQWHRIAQQERQLIQTEVEKNAQFIDRNRQEIQANRQALQQGFDQLRLEMLGLEERQRLVEMRNAASVLESAITSRAGIATEWMERFEPEDYRQAQSMLEDAERKFQAGDYRAASGVAGHALQRMATVAANVEREQKTHQRAREEAFRYYDELVETMEKLSADDKMALWYGQQCQALSQKVQELEGLARTENYLALGTQEYETLKERSMQLLAEADQLSHDLEDAERKHFERRENAKSFIKALAAQGDYRPFKPVFENTASPHSDIILHTEEGLTMRLALDGDVMTEFPPGKDTDEMTHWMEKFSQTCQQQGFAQIGSQPIG